MTTAMTFQDANDMALEFGAKKFQLCPTKAAELFGCWADRIAMLPMKAEQGAKALGAHVEECNRYAGERLSYLSAGAKRKR